MIIWNDRLFSFSPYTSLRKSNNTHRKAMSHGTKRSPAHLNTHKNAAKKGAPMANPIPQLFSRSVTNSEGVVLLKPCFSSNTKVEYIENGRVGMGDALLNGYWEMRSNKIQCHLLRTSVV